MPQKADMYAHLLSTVRGYGVLRSVPDLARCSRLHGDGFFGYGDDLVTSDV